MWMLPANEHGTLFKGVRKEEMVWWGFWVSSNLLEGKASFSILLNGVVVSQRRSGKRTGPLCSPHVSTCRARNETVETIELLSGSHVHLQVNR